MNLNFARYLIELEESKGGKYLIDKIKQDIEVQRDNLEKNIRPEYKDVFELEICTSRGRINGLRWVLEIINSGAKAVALDRKNQSLKMPNTI